MGACLLNVACRRKGVGENGGHGNRYFSQAHANNTNDMHHEAIDFLMKIKGTHGLSSLVEVTQ